MLPVLFHIKALKIYTFGAFLVVAFFWGLFWLWRNFKRTNFREEYMFDSVFIALIGGGFAARLIYVVEHFNRFGFSVLKFILINGYPGLSLVGFIIGFVLSILAYTKIRKWPFFEVIAYMVPSFFLSLGIGKLGSFFAGTTVGTQTKFILSMQYLGYEGSRHITAVYESIIFFVGFMAAQQLLMKYRRDDIHVSSLFSFFVIITALSQLILDNFKEDAVYLGRLRIDVVIAAVFFVVFGASELYKYRKTLGAKITTFRIRPHKKRT